MSNFMKIRPVGAELFHADGRTDRHDEANSRFHNFANAPKKQMDEYLQIRLLREDQLYKVHPRIDPAIPGWE
jgi:hypothetical protein